MVAGGNVQQAASVSGPILTVIPGDYFELFLKVEADASITVQSEQSYFAMEIIE